MLKIKLGARVKLKNDYSDLKKGHQGVIVGIDVDSLNDLLLVLFDNYHNGHNSSASKEYTTYLKGYSYERLRKIDGGCWWVRPKHLQPICLLKSWKGKGK